MGGPEAVKMILMVLNQKMQRAKLTINNHMWYCNNNVINRKRLLTFLTFFFSQHATKNKNNSTEMQICYEYAKRAYNMDKLKKIFAETGRRLKLNN